MATLMQWLPYILTAIGALITLLSVVKIVRSQLRTEARAYRYWTKFRPSPAERYRLKRPDNEPTDY